MTKLTTRELVSRVARENGWKESHLRWERGVDRYERGNDRIVARFNRIGNISSVRVQLNGASDFTELGTSVKGGRRAAVLAILESVAAAPPATESEPVRKRLPGRPVADFATQREARLEEIGNLHAQALGLATEGDLVGAQDKIHLAMTTAKMAKSVGATDAQVAEAIVSSYPVSTAMQRLQEM
jgi:hypothetical protein